MPELAVAPLPIVALVYCLLAKQLKVPCGAAAGQDEEGRPVASAPGAAAAAGSGRRARARWLLACTLGRNPDTAAYRSGGGDSDAPQRGHGPAGPVLLPHIQPVEPVADLTRDAVVERGSDGPRVSALPAIRSSAHAAI